MVNIVVDAAVAIKLFSITVQSNMILPTNIHSYLVICETLFDNRRIGESGKGKGGTEKEREREERDNKGKERSEGLERKGEGREQEEIGERKRERREGILNITELAVDIIHSPVWDGS